MGIVNEEDDQADDSGDIINLVHLHQLLAEEQISSVRHFEETLNSTEDVLSWVAKGESYVEYKKFVYKE